jgi:hypothetical protein
MLIINFFYMYRKKLINKGVYRISMIGGLVDFKLLKKVKGYLL